MPSSAPPAIVKVLIPAVLGVAVLGLGGMMYMGQVRQTQRVQQQLAMAQQQVNSLQLQNQDLSQQLETMQAERQTLDEKVSALRAQLAMAASTIEKTQASVKELQERHGTAAAERDQLQQRLSEASVQRETMTKKLTRLEVEKSDAEKSLVQSREQITLLDRDYRKMAQQVAELEARPLPGVDPLVTVDPRQQYLAGSGASSSTISGAVELPPIIVRKDRVSKSPAVRGRLMEVHPDHNFIVVDKGSLDGVRMGMTFDIIRNGSVIGRATVVRVRPQLSACDVLRSGASGMLQVGDAAVQSGS